MDTVEEIKTRFKKELEGISNLDELKDLYATELAKRDKMIFDLQKQNEIILKSTFRNKDLELSAHKNY